ncbi:hypothetical protein MHPYR_820009 [uncultured Mycobacterium sp.]|uniref:Uncharacterized protein n=1 Tax=uncultured Mycobacterium sp. TaxID=171292 RepID=A0A1Y5PLM1_9MYCO|nr:hypothetical protein MHPYR_820009 [uncultured Mycobacterium sp.]
MGRMWWCAQPVISRRCPIYDTSDREVVPVAEGLWKGCCVHGIVDYPSRGRAGDHGICRERHQRDSA